MALATGFTFSASRAAAAPTRA
eukprot:COSAG06_NODE_41608_length_389_cov_1.351724_2_plen_21_part_01